MPRAFPLAAGLPPARATANVDARPRRASGIDRARRSGNAIETLRSAEATAVAPEASP